jgi:adenosylcobinamide-GDP ribazoletransferase
MARVRGARSAFALLTAFPLQGRPTRDALWWFPAVGALIGAIVGVVWWASEKIWVAAIAAALALAADAACTGLLHLDGLSDAADGLLPPLERTRRLAVMSDPRAGAFGVVVTALVLLARWSALAALSPSPVLIVAIWTASRTWMAATMSGVPYARGEEGLASGYVSAPRTWQLLAVAGAGMAAAVVLSAAWRPIHGPIAVAGGTLAAAVVVLFGHRRIRGFTGDVLGAAGVMGETVALLLAVAKW